MKINEKYKLIFKVEGNLLTFTGVVIAEDDTLLTFIDKFNKTITYNKALLISAEEVGE